LLRQPRRKDAVQLNVNRSDTGEQAGIFAQISVPLTFNSRGNAEMITFDRQSKYALAHSTRGANDNQFTFHGFAPVKRPQPNEYITPESYLQPARIILLIIVTDEDNEAQL
jgi:hypothetical protein